MIIVVGGVVEKDGKYLLVQEAQKQCYGKWNLPAGHLDVNESIEDGAKREIREETNCDVEITGICLLDNRILKDDLHMKVIFTTKLLSEDINFDTDEILDAKWFSYEELVNMKDKLRADYIIPAIENNMNGITAPLDIIHYS